MIELTEHQLDKFHNGYVIGHEEFGAQVENADELLTDLVNSLTIDQIKQLAEQHNASVIEWVEFGKNEKSTWPIINDPVLVYPPPPTTLAFYGGKEETGRVSWYELGFFECQNITHWAYLPQPKGT